MLVKGVTGSTSVGSVAGVLGYTFDLINSHRFHVLGLHGGGATRCGLANVVPAGYYGERV